MSARKREPAARPRLYEEVRGPVREIPTPEGVPLRFPIALAGDRAGAFLLDALLIVLVLLALLLVASIGSYIDDAAANSLFMLSFFLLRNFYFAGFEILWRGRTPGKRLVGLQVVDRTGHALRVEALFARNLMREMEIFIPLIVLVGGDAIWPGMPPWGRLLVVVWVLFFAFFPLLNRDRLRIGDLIAGTLVVRSPRRALLPDLADDRSSKWRGAGRPPPVPDGPRFERQHLERYGIYELQVLERVLREANTPKETLTAVAERIVEKIGWTAKVRDPRKFLEAFYRAQRAHLEQRMLLGDRREDKHALGGPEDDRSS